MNLKSDQSKIIYSTVFIGSGVGVTCLLPMLISAIEQQEPLLWIQAGENERNMLFASEVKHALMKAQSFAKGVVWYRYATKEDKQQLPEDVESVWKKQRPEDVENAFNEVEKHFGEVQLKYVLPQDENECKMIQRVYLCGSSSFMKEMASQLLKLGLESDRILYETYGPHTVLVPRPIPVLSSIA